MEVRDVCNLALRKIGKLGSGREPRLVDQTDTLDALRALYATWIGTGAFGRLSDVIPNADYVAGENQRIFRNSDAVLEITLPETVPAYSQPLPYNRERDTYTTYENIAANVRPPRDGAVVVIADAFQGTTASFIYDGQVRKWQQVDGLVLNDEAPRSASDPQGLAACLAMEIVDQFGGEVSAATARQAARYLSTLAMRFSTPSRTSVGVYA